MAADPDLACAVLLQINQPGPPQAQALGGDVALWHQALGDQPLRQAGVQAAGDRIFVDAQGRGKGDGRSERD